MRQLLKQFPFRQVASTLLLSCSVLSVSSQDAEPINIVVAASKMNIVYCDIENPLTIAVPGAKCEDLVVSVSSGILTGSGCGYTVRPERGRWLIVVRAEWKEGNTVRTASNEFRVRDLPTPSALLGGRAADDGTIRLIDAQASRGVPARLQGFEFDVVFKVVHFRFRIQRGAATVFDSEAGGAKLSQTMIDASGSLAVGDVIRVSDIRGMGPSGKIHELKALRLEVIE